MKFVYTNVVSQICFENSPQDFARSETGAWGIPRSNRYLLLLYARGNESDYLKLTRCMYTPQTDVYCYDFHNRFSSFNIYMILRTVMQNPWLIKCCVLRFPYHLLMLLFC